MSVVGALDADALAEATSLLDSGRLVLVPTDTSYAIAADALSEEGVDAAFRLKARPADVPLAVGVGGIEDANQVGFPTPLARRLAEALWPGPLLLVLKARPWLPDALTAGGDTVAIRAPEDGFARNLARHFGPLVLTTARRPGGRDLLRVEEARDAFGDEIALYVDAGPLSGGRATVVDATGAEAKVLCDGKVPAPRVAEHGRVRD